MNPILPSPASHPLHTDLEFCAWIGQATPGEQLEYHRGLLAVDAADVVSILPRPERRRLTALARVAHRAFEAGLVHLVQVRHGPDCFAYLAIARPRKHKAAAASASLPSLLLEAA